MTKVFLALLILISVSSFGQVPHLIDNVLSANPEIHYYKFYNGIQMIEFDYLPAYQRKVNYLEQTRPRALEWSTVLGPPHPNIYLFRNENGKIVKRYGDTLTTKLLTVQESLKIAETHNSSETQLGIWRFSNRYFPYYLIGTQSEILSDSLCGLIDSLGNEVLPKEYSKIWKRDNIFITRKDECSELRDINLMIKFSSDEFYLQPAQFHRGSADIYMRKDNKYGLMDSTGKIIVSCEYNMLIGEFNELGLAEVYKKGLIGYVNTLGKEVITCKYQSVGYFKEGLLNVRYEEKWGYITANGKTIIPHKYDIGFWFEDGLARVAKKEAGQYYYGFIDKEGNEVIPLVYSDAKDFENGIAKVMVDGNWIKIDRNGNRLN